MTIQLESLRYQTTVIYGGLPQGRSCIRGDCDNTTREPRIPNCCDT